MSGLNRYAAAFAALCLVFAAPALAQEAAAPAVDKKAEAAAKKADAAAKKAEADAKKKEEAEKKKAEAAAKKADADAKKAEADAAKKADAEKKKLEADAKKAEAAAKKADADAAKKADAEKKKLEADAKKADAAAKKAEADVAKKADAEKKKLEADAKKADANAAKADADAKKKEEADKKKVEADAKKAAASAKQAEAAAKKAEAAAAKLEAAAAKKAAADVKKAEAKRLKDEAAARAKAEADAKKAEAKRLKDEAIARKKADEELKKQEAEAKRLGKPWPPVPEQQPTLAAEPDFNEPIAPSKPSGDPKKTTTMDAGGERPWARGVPKAKQEEAIALFRDGNAHLRDSLWSKAVEKYNAALRIWDHPGIHYNLALALVNLDRPIETHEHLQAALKYGAMPLDSDKHDQALRYMVLVEKQLTRIDVRCDLEGASVKLDGRELFVGPGRYEGLVTAGRHSIIATKEGYLPREINENFTPGDTRVVDVILQTEADLSEMKRLFSNAIPWAVLLGGVAVAGGSVGVHFAADGAFKDYDRGINDCSNADPVVGGCTPSLSLQAKRGTGETLQSLAFVGYSVGGAAIVTGAILLYVNRLQPYRRQQVDVVNTKPEVTLAPMFGPGVGGASLHVSF